VLLIICRSLQINARMVVMRGGERSGSAHCALKSANHDVSIESAEKGRFTKWASRSARAPSRMWEPLMATLAAEGYRCVAPDQRGYSPGARPQETDA
jgi:pimeloyl-ACP methyl ester carboxylesterase